MVYGGIFRFDPSAQVPSPKVLQGLSVDNPPPFTGPRIEDRWGRFVQDIPIYNGQNSAAVFQALIALQSTYWP